MLQGIAGRSLQSGEVLIAGALGEDVFAKEAVEGRAAAQVVAAPGGFSFDPGFRLGAENQAVRFLQRV